MGSDKTLNNGCSRHCTNTPMEWIMRSEMHFSRYLSLGENSKLVSGDPALLINETHKAHCICKSLHKFSVEVQGNLLLH